MLFDLEGLEEVTFIGFQKPAGFWVISDGYRIGMYKRPGWFHRLMTRWLLGWRWEDAC